MKKLCLFFADNCSADNTLQVLEQEKERYKDVFSAFEILPQRENGGFGRASNAAARAGNSDIIFFYNVDTEIFPDAFVHLEHAIQNAAPETVAFELRQFPYEHPKYYDPVTLETSWASGACFVLKRRVFEETGGFDESIFMYCEDVELSWHIRALGYKLQYVPAAVTWHYAYETPGQEKSAQVVGGLCGNLVLRYKYGSPKQIKEGLRLVKKEMGSVTADEGRRAMWEAGQQRLNKMRRSYRNFFRRVVKKSGFAPQFLGLDYEFVRRGAYYRNEPFRTAPEDLPEITVVVRTFRRPESLRLTLQSLKNQTYRAFHVIVVEDGETPVSRQVAEEAGAWFPVEYLAANSRWGRCRAGNEGVARAHTEYVCFLDDDDYFFADHLETMAHAVAEHPDAGFWCAGAVEAQCPDAQRMAPVFKRNTGKEELRPIDFFCYNPVAIQSVVFRKELYLSVGGLDTGLDALEDWDLWMRMVCKAPVFTVDKSTSVFRVPADPAAFAIRCRQIDAYRERLFQKMANYRLPLSAQDVLRIFWQPENNGSAERLNWEEWRARAAGLTDSGTWRITGWLRRLFYTLDEKFLRFAGPAPILFEEATAAQLRSYCIKIERSACWRFANRLKQFFRFGSNQT